MEDQLISFETAKLAKEKGFNWLAAEAFDDCGNEVNTEELWATFSGPKSISGWYHDYNIHFISRPTQSLLQRWLREVHKIEVYSIPVWSESCYENKNAKLIGYNCNIEFPGYENVNLPTCKTHEMVVEIGLLEALKLIK